MAIGFPASHEGSRRLSVAYPEVLEAIQDTFEILEWPSEPVSSGVFRVKRGMSMLSYGERIEIQAAEDGTVRVKSRCVWPLQILDWGQNRKNVNEFFRALDGLLRG